MLTTMVAAFTESKNNVALYWGQNSIGTKTNGTTNEKNLTYYCQQDNVDIVLLSFLSEFPGTYGIPTLSFTNYEFSYQYQTPLLGLASQIDACQNNGKLVLLSLGGEGSNYGFLEEKDGTVFAEALWNMFGPPSESTNTSVIRPFGNSTLIDGFDLDLESKNDTGYIDLAYTLRQKINQTNAGSSSNKTYYLSFAPQCPTANNPLENIIYSSYFDFAFIQFYNNPENCNANTGLFNWDSWSSWATNLSANKDVKIFLGLPGSSKAAASGYISNSTVLNEKVAEAYKSNSFAGVSLFDAGTAFNNDDAPDSNYVNMVKEALSSATISTSSSASSSASSSSSSTKSHNAGVSGYTVNVGLITTFFFTLINMVF